MVNVDERVSNIITGGCCDPFGNTDHKKASGGLANLKK